MGVMRTEICGPETAVVGQSEACDAAQSPIDAIMTRRIACRDFAMLRSRDERSSRYSTSRASRQAVRTSSPGMSTC
jgi:hypothetical protein